MLYLLYIHYIWFIPSGECEIHNSILDGMKLFYIFVSFLFIISNQLSVIIMVQYLFNKYLFDG